MTDADLAAIVRALAPAVKAAIEPLTARLVVLEQRQPIPGRDGLNGRDGLSVTGPMGPQGLPGETGQIGAMGNTGANGKDGAPGERGEKGERGADGFSLKDFSASFDLETKSLTLAFDDGTNRHEHKFSVPFQIHKGIYVDGQDYLAGDTVTWGGSTWIAKADTTAKPGLSTEESRVWMLACQRGRDGKQGQKGDAGPQGLRGEKGDRGPDRW